MNTACEQLEGAALSLARSGTIKDRLADAWRNHLALLEAEALPERLRAEFRACQAALTREPPLRGEDAVRATVRKMSSHEADELACTVVKLFAATVREVSREEALQENPEHTVSALPVASRGKAKAAPQVVSLYAAEG
jgi:hypothetical protein